jgi:methylated-DNA-[protein]-cysteine S-methyltransferase
MEKIYFAEWKSPLGTLVLESDGRALTRIRLPDEEYENDPAARRVRRPGLFRDAALQLKEYFAGTRKEFDLPLNPAGTPFQNEVWAELVKIPRGETLSYSELAERVGRPGSHRAVGAANGRNPLPIVIPCHRVIGKSGKLTGYAGGLAAKQKLLELEGALETAG